jgi:uncharacterized protein (DUF58 family)
MPRPTRRTTTLIITALLLYLFANQTQVGWLYVMAAVIAGIIIAALLLNARMLGGLRLDRHVAPQEISEGDEVTITLSLSSTRRAGAAQVAATERCPVAAPDDPARAMLIFVPTLSGRAAADLTYSVEVYRRGLHTFPAITLESGAPFGVCRSRRVIGPETRMLVYPEVIRLSGLDLLDRRPAPQRDRPRAGLGAEVMGVRPYQSGDSPRHIHWRSVARRGTLVSKEFVDEAEPGVTLLLDLFAHPYPADNTKHVPFEWAIKAAASIADYARRRGYPLYIAADADALPPPTGPLGLDALMQYLARVEPVGRYRVNDALGGAAMQSFVAALLPWPDTAAVEVLAGLRHSGREVLALIADPASFPAGGPSAEPLLGALQAAHVEAHPLRFGSDLAAQVAGEQAEFASVRPR